MFCFSSLVLCNFELQCPCITRHIPGQSWVVVPKQDMLSTDSRVMERIPCLHNYRQTQEFLCSGCTCERFLCCLTLVLFDKIPFCPLHESIIFARVRCRCHTLSHCAPCLTSSLPNCFRFEPTFVNQRSWFGSKPTFVNTKQGLSHFATEISIYILNVNSACICVSLCFILIWMSLCLYAFLFCDLVSTQPLHTYI